MRESTRTSRRLPAVADLLVYVVVGAVALIGGEQIASRLAGRSGMLASLYGMASTAAAIAVVVLARRWIKRRHRDSADEGMTTDDERLLGLSFPMMVALIVALAMIGGVISVNHHVDLVRTQLHAAVDIQATRIGQWWQRNLATTEFINTSQPLGDRYAAWQNGKDPNGLDVLMSRVAALAREPGVTAVGIVGPDGRTLYGDVGTLAAQYTEMGPTLAQARTTGAAARRGPFRTDDGRVVTEWLIPLPAERGPRPVVVVRAELGATFATGVEGLLPPSTTGELLLVSDVNGTPAVVTSPRFSRPGHPAAGALQGFAEAVRAIHWDDPDLVRLVDYRGASVLATAERVDGTDWLVLGKVDYGEAYAAAAHDLIAIALGGVLAVLLVGARLASIDQKNRLALMAMAKHAQDDQVRDLQLLAAIANSSEDAIYAKDRDGRYRFFNRAAERFAGQASIDVIGKRDDDIFGAGRAASVAAVEARVLESGAIDTADEELPTVIGKRTFMALRGPLRDTNGKLLGTFGILRDITERKQREDELQRQNVEFARLNRVAVDRELRMVELKQTINALSAELGRPLPYPVAERAARGAATPGDPT